MVVTYLVQDREWNVRGSWILLLNSAGITLHITHNWQIYLDVEDYPFTTENAPITSEKNDLTIAKVVDSRRLTRSSKSSDSEQKLKDPLNSELKLLCIRH